MFLSKHEIEALTGYKRPADQRRWLSRRGWAFEVRADGTNCVLVEEARNRMLTGAVSPRATEPNLAALRRRG
jgi:hypothetical protein